jgi:NAD(P)-dependent dehydrogenase (short-subunit alcohol dehydrogenase family)
MHDAAPIHEGLHDGPGASFDGRVALVTGAASGLGRATAALLARRGARVLVVDRDAAGGGATVEAIRAAGGEAEFLRAEATRADDARAAVGRCLERWGGLDVAVNNAGVEGDRRPTADYDEDEWRRVIDTNLTGVFLGMKHQIPALLARGRGAIVNVGSTASIAGVAAMPAYVAAKHGLLGLTRTAALDYAERGLRINAVLPGSFRTPMSERLYGEDALDAVVTAVTPMRRVGSVEEIARAIAWLCSDDASFVTGAGLSVDGGKRAA